MLPDFWSDFENWFSVIKAYIVFSGLVYAEYPIYLLICALAEVCALQVLLVCIKLKQVSANL